MPVNYIEKGAGLHAAIAAAGHRLEQRDGTWISSDDEAVQAIIDSFDPLPVAKAAAWERIKAERERRKVAGVTVGEHRFHSDPDSRTQFLGLALDGQDGVPQGVMWKTIGGTFVPLTWTLVTQVRQAIMQADIALFAAAEMKRAAVNALQDLAAVEAFDATVGWPEV